VMKSGEGEGSARVHFVLAHDDLWGTPHFINPDSKLADRHAIVALEHLIYCTC
jgi:hypothetical protein